MCSILSPIYREAKWNSKKLSDFSQMVQLVHDRDQLQSQILWGKFSAHLISFLTSKSKPSLSPQHGPLGLPSSSLRETALVRSTDHLHWQIQWSLSVFILHNFLSTFKAIGLFFLLWPFPKWLPSCGKCFSYLSRSFFFVSFDGSSSTAQPINVPMLNPGPSFSLFSCSLLL